MTDLNQGASIEAELMPCPMCGGAAHLTKGYATENVWSHGEFHRVFCGACQIRQLFHQTAADAIAVWNRRSVPPAAGGDELPPLPKAPCLLPGVYAYRREDMQDYARAAYAMGRGAAVRDYVNLNDAAIAADRAQLSAKGQGEPVAEVDEGDEGLFIEFIYGPDGSPLKRGDKLYLAAPASAQLADPSNAEFLAKRLSRVAKLTGAHIPEHFTHEQIAEVAGTILGEIARRLENGPQPADLHCKWPTCQSEEVQQQVADQAYRELYSGAQPADRECSDCEGSGRVSPNELCARCDASGVLPGAQPDQRESAEQAEKCRLRLCCRADHHAAGCTTYDPARYPDEFADDQRESAAERSREWQSVTEPGQVRKGDKLRFKIGDKAYSERAKLILEAGTDKEEVVYDIGRNFYFITSMVIGGRSNHKGVEFLSKQGQDSANNSAEGEKA
jgi:hypothetical protein